MNMKDRIGTHLPYLRRFARALSGSQQSGDAYVLAMLEALVADPTSLRKDLEDRVAVYQYFLKIWDMAPINNNVEPPPGDNLTALSSLTPRSRQAFLLTSIEGFSTEEATQVMDVTPEEFSKLLDKAGREIAEQVATEILIIEDEPIIAMDLQSIVEELGHTVTDVARTHSEAVKAATQTRRPGLVLADIQLADGSSGLDAVNEILQHFEVPVIFITAYPERLLTGAKPEPAFLITKPFQTKALKAIISQAIFFREKAIRKAA
ncbi:MAG: response regulator [Pseudomonadota bacterium]